MVNPLSTFELSLCQCSVSPTLMITLAGPFVPEYRVSPMLTQSQRLSTLKLPCALAINATSARTVHRSLLP
jgi:hypothetical protein